MFKTSTSISILVGFLILNNVLCESSLNSTLGKFWKMVGLSGESEEDKDIVFSDEEEGENEDERKEIDPDENCFICFDEKLTVTLQPCGHLLGNFCANFFLQESKPCPTCRKDVDHFENIDSIDDRPDVLFVQRYNIERENELRELTAEAFKSFMDRLKRGEVPLEEVEARYWYLRRGQEPDAELLKEIKSTLWVSATIKWNDFRNNVLKHCLSPSVEHMLYRKFFKRTLSIKEKHMLKRYFIRKGLDVKKEFLLRQKYLKPKIENVNTTHPTQPNPTLNF